MTAPTDPDEVVNELPRRPWEGSVRELETAIERAVVLSRGGPLRIELFEPPPEPQSPQAEVVAVEDLPLNLREVQWRVIERALRLTGGNRMRAARLLGISDRSLRGKLNVGRAE